MRVTLLSHEFGSQTQEKKMTKFRKYCVLLLILMTAVAGCGARMEVARENLQEQIDGLLGEAKVQQKLIQHSIAEMDVTLQGLRRQRITSEVQHEQIQRKTELTRSQLHRIDEGLANARNLMLQSAQPTSLNAVRENPKRVAERLLQNRRVLTEQMEGLEKAKHRLQRVYNSLAQREAYYEDQIAEFRGQMAVIDTQSMSLRLMQEAGQAMNQTDPAVNQGLISLREKINAFSARLEVDCRMEDESWKVTERTGELASIESTLAALRTSESVIQEIDTLVGQLPQGSGAH